MLDKGNYCALLLGKGKGKSCALLMDTQQELSLLYKAKSCELLLDLHYELLRAFIPPT